MRAIDADVLLHVLETGKCKLPRKYLSWDMAKCLVEKFLDKVPALDVEPVRHGRWKENEHGYVCSECDDYFIDGYYTNEIVLSRYKYCPLCGAKMDGGASNG